MTAPHHLLTEAFTAAQTIGILSRMQVVVSMRLHGLIFSASQGVPLVGIVYDQKVSSFLSYIGQDLYEGLDQLKTVVKYLSAFGVPAENFFIVTWMPDAEAAEAKIAALREEGDCVACCVDLAEEWNFG